MIKLVDVDERVLAELEGIATEGAKANEVTPPLSEGNEWTAERIEWFRRYHRAARAGIDGPAAEATWAVAADGIVVGSVRLKATGETGLLETGIWLERASRHQGIGRAAMTEVLVKAIEAGATGVCAETSTANDGARALLLGVGFKPLPPEGRAERRATWLWLAP